VNSNRDGYGLEWQDSDATLRDFDDYQGASQKFLFILVQRGEDSSSNVFRQHALTPNLDYTWPSCMSKGQYSSEIKIVCKDGVSLC
jgi:hypothetical protein